MKGEIESFVRGLGHEPNDLALFELAFTHSSVDRVLGMVIAAALYRRYPNEPEGDLSRRYNGLVDRDTCAENGREIGVPALIKLGKQAREDGANRSENVVGDVVEALIGALFIDGGIEAAERFILKLWGPDIASQRGAPQHPKSALQELAAAKGCKPPEYEVVGRTGAHHAPKFTIRVSVAKLGEAMADGSSKQEAETAAATALLSQLQ